MSYRGEFTWEPDEDRAQRMRIMGAVALLCAGWAVGFFAGRMSAWLFPVTDTQIVVMQQAPQDPPAPTQAAQRSPALPAAAKETPTAKGGEPDASARQAQPGAPGSAAAQPPALGSGTPDKGHRNEVAAQPNDETAPGSARPEEVTANSKVTVINPDAASTKPASVEKEPMREPENRKRAAREPAPDAEDLYRPVYGYQSSDQAAIMECERRYNSFRRSDGTYQPFNSPTRELCPLLR